MRLLKLSILSLSSLSSLFSFDFSQLKKNPEIYQDIIIKNEVVYKGKRACEDRYDAIKDILSTLPRGFKSLDIGASQGYFSFKMAEDFDARCTMIEEGYTYTNHTWITGQLLLNLCKENSHLKNLNLLQTKVYSKDLFKLSQMEQFDIVLAFSVIHHMANEADEDYTPFRDTIDSILKLSNLVIIETPVNTGKHTEYLQKYLKHKKGQLIHSCARGSLIYELYLFDNRKSLQSETLPNLLMTTYKMFKGTYPY